MIAVQKHGNMWMVVRLDSTQQIVSVIRSYRQQAAACRLLMKLYDAGEA